MNKLNKIGLIIKDRKKIRGYFDVILNENKQNEILDKYNIHSLSQLQISKLLELFNYNLYSADIKIKIDFSNGISPVNDYYFLCILAKAMNIKTYFEFGTWLGLSAFNIAQNTGPETRIYTLDIPLEHPDLQLYNIPPDIFGYYSKGTSNIHHLKGDSKNFGYNEFRKKAELIFIDGNHSYEYVKNDSRIALEMLKDDNSVIAWHDYILCEEINKDVLCGILDAIPSDEHKYLIHLYQSNLALYSRSFNFEKNEMPKWNIPETKFELQFKIKH